MTGPFDEIVDRTGRRSVKYDLYEREGQPKDAFPMWVADMDFRAPKAVLDGLKEMSEYGIFGYSHLTDSCLDAMEQWFEERFHWKIPRQGVIQIPGIMFGIAAALNALTRKGDPVLIQEPVYPPFREVVERNGRRLIVNQLVLKNGRYSIDFEKLEEQIKSEEVKLFLFCSPHNPVGRVWTEEELRRVGELMLHYQIPIISDECHADLVYSGKKHRIFASLSEELADQTILCVGPSKTFNLPGIQVANLVVSNPNYYRILSDETMKYLYYGVGLPALIAMENAYRYGGPWKDELIVYLEGNLRYVLDEIAELSPRIIPIVPEATYLLWLDCRGLGLKDQELSHFWSHRAKLWLSPGVSFGLGGSGFMRMNIATPRALLQKAIRRLKAALN